MATNVRLDDPDHVLELVRDFFIELEEEPDYFPEESAYRIIFSNEDEEPVFACIAEVDREGLRLVVRTCFAQHVEEDRRPPVAEFMTRLNSGLFCGCFLIDIEDGEFGFRASIPFRDVEVGPALVRNAVLEAVSATETYIGPLAAVIDGELTPKEAFESVVED